MSVGLVGRVVLSGGTRSSQRRRPSATSCSTPRLSLQHEGTVSCRGYDNVVNFSLIYFFTLSFSIKTTYRWFLNRLTTRCLAKTEIATNLLGWYYLQQRPNWSEL